MNLILHRNKFGDQGIFGNIVTDDSNSECVCLSLEHAYLNNTYAAYGKYGPKVPSGIYTCTRRMSPKFGFEVFMLNNVPNCTFIEIHIGCFQEDSEGCILVGCGIGIENGFTMLTDSKIAFDHFMQLQQGVNMFKLTITS
jgi:hypothetical protein